MAFSSFMNTSGGGASFALPADPEQKQKFIDDQIGIRTAVETKEKRLLALTDPNTYLTELNKEMDDAFAAIRKRYTDVYDSLSHLPESERQAMAKKTALQVRDVEMNRIQSTYGPKSIELVASKRSGSVNITAGGGGGEGGSGN